MSSTTALMLGVSGLRGVVGTTLTPEVATAFAAAFAAYLKLSPPRNASHPVVVVGRDSRPSGPFVRDAICAGLHASGVEVVDLEVVTTPGVALMVRHLQADAGMIATASHNPIEWNGIKLLDSRSIAPPPPVVREIVRLFERRVSAYTRVDDLRRPRGETMTNALHVKTVTDLLDVNGIVNRRFKVVLDSINGAGGLSGMTLLSKLGCVVSHLNGEPTGRFAHDPEPAEQNLTHLAAEVKRQGADVGFAQDPDADRLAIVDQTGTYIGEEYTLALCCRYILSRKPGSSVAANLSTSRMLDDIAIRYGCNVIRTPVGEANVIDAMLRHGCVIGGEGNGGVIDPRVVPGRDSLVAMAYVLSLMARENKPLTAIVAEMPRYQIIKTKFECPREGASRAVAALQEKFATQKLDLQDGIRIDWPQSWVHARSSNTEPVMRIIAEAPTRQIARDRIDEVRSVIDQALRQA